MNDITVFGLNPEELLPNWESLVAALIPKLIIIGVCCLIYLLIDYILRSLAYARIGHRRGIPLWGLAWIPGLRLITLGGIADDHDRKTVGRRHGFRVLLPILLLLCLGAILADIFMLRSEVNEFSQAVLADPQNILEAFSSFSGGKLRMALITFASVVGSLLSIFRTIAIYKLLESCKRKHTFLNMILYLLIPFAAPFVLIAVSGSDSDKKKKKKHHPRPVIEYEDEEEPQAEQSN